MLDLELGKAFWVSKQFSLSPFVGLRGEWLLRSSHMRAGDESSAKSWHHFIGIGPRVGAYADWIFGAGFSLFSDLGLSLLYGHLDSGASLTRDDGWIDTENATKHIKEDITFDAGIQIGLKWGRSFNDRVYFSLKAGWEQLIFWRTWTSITSTTNAITTQGLTFGACLDF